MTPKPKTRPVRSDRSDRSLNFWLLRRVVCVLSLLLPLPVFSQQKGPGQLTPVIGYAFPAGGRQGTRFEVTVGGANLTGTTAAVFAGAGVGAEVVKIFKPLNKNRENTIRDLLQAEREKMKTAKRQPGFTREEDLLSQIAEKAGISADEVAAYREGIMQRRDPKHQLNPQLVERVTLRVTIAADAQPGNREVRLLAPNGLSNPVAFQIGVLAEVTEAEPNDRLEQAAAAVTLPAVINGRILPGDVDHFSFDARKGRNLTLAVAARELIPYLADAVPGWFQANLTLLDSKGREIAFADDFGHRPDPLICVTIPADGRYTLRIRDSICRGREDFVYRISAGELPCLTEQFPIGGQLNTRVDLRVAGWNLPERKLPVDAGATPGWRNIGLQAPAIGFVRFEVGRFPEFAEPAPDAKPAPAPLDLRFPCTVNALISQPGEHDVFALRLPAAAPVVAEIRARRLGSPLDSMLRITDAEGKAIASNDDHDDPAAGLETHHADSRVTFTPPRDGIYQFHVSDTQGKGSRAHAYRLTIAPPQPGFDLRIVPSSLNGRAGAMVPLTAHVVRHDGYAGDIELALVDAPPGFELAGAKIPAGTDSVRLTLKLPDAATRAPVPLAIEGRARIGNQDVVRAAVPAEDRMQAFFYRHLVPAEELLACVLPRPQGTNRRPGTLAGIERFHAACAAGIAIPAGGSATLSLPGLGAISNNRPLKFALNAPPPGITLETKPNGGATDFMFRADAAQTKPGPLGNLIVSVFAEVQPRPVEGKPNRKPQPILVATLPPIPGKIIAK